MPWPFLPPNPDTHPAPFDGDYFVFGLGLTGMRPYDEQADHSFSVDGVKAGVWVPIVENGGEHAYRGVGIAPLSRVGSRATYKSLYVPYNKANSHSVDVDARALTGSILGVSATRNGSKVTFTVQAQTDGRSGYSVVVAPYSPTMPKLTSLEAYAAAGGWSALSSGGTTTVAIKPGNISQFAVFLARGLPKEISPASGGKSVKV